MANRDADWVINTYDNVPLGQILVDERLRYLLIQSMVAADSGVHQSSLSAYEHCRVTPSWDVFVRILKAMNRKAVIQTEPLVSDMLTIRSVRIALDNVLKIVDGRPYRLEGDAAAYVLGRGKPIDNLIVTFEGDPANLDELATSCASRLRTVQTVRGGLYTPQIRFEVDGGMVVLRVVQKARPSIEVAFEGLMVHVPPLDELGLDNAA